MKLLKGISLFILYPVTMFAIGFVTNMFVMEYFYPGQTKGEITEISVRNETNTQPEAKPVAVSDKRIVTANTEFIVQKYDTSGEFMGELKEILPDKYIGMTREALVKEIHAWNQNPPLTDLEQGFQYIELQSFSPQRIVVRKTYTGRQEEGFFLLNENHCVVVYQRDLQNVYLTTDIKVDDLPEQLKEEILHIKYVENEKELYNFLESYSS